jgi:hypothetical protein
MVIWPPPIDGLALLLEEGVELHFAVCRVARDDQAVRLRDERERQRRRERDCAEACERCRTNWKPTATHTACSLPSRSLHEFERRRGGGQRSTVTQGVDVAPS